MNGETHGKSIRRIKFIPKKGSEVFANDQPLIAYLKDTKNPKIKKLQPIHENEESKSLSIPKSIFSLLEKQAVLLNLTTEEFIMRFAKSSTTMEVGKNPEQIRRSELQKLADDSLTQIVRATALIIKEQNQKNQTDAIQIFEHALSILLSLKTKEDAGKAELDQLQQLLKDLSRLREATDSR